MSFTGVWLNMRCSDCRRPFSVAVDVEALLTSERPKEVAHAALRRDGWLVTPPLHWCPRCAKKTDCGVLATRPREFTPDPTQRGGDEG